MKPGLALIIIALLYTVDQFYLAAAYDDNSLFEDGFKGMPSDINNLEEIIPSGLKEIIPNINVGMDMIEKRCAILGTNESFPEFKKAMDSFSKCIVKIVSYGNVTLEINRERQTGNLDKVFRKYCKKSGEIRHCVDEFAKAWLPCLTATEQQNMPVLKNISEALTNFVCFKEGDRIALFISEGGPECLNSTQNNVVDICSPLLVTPESLTRVLKSAESYNSTVLDFPLLRLNENDCEDISLFQKCTVSHLENCTEPTPANIIDSMFKYVIKSTKCQQYQVSSSYVTVGNVFLIMAAFLCIKSGLVFTLTRLN